MTEEELDAARRGGASATARRGLRLLGFRPLSWLAPHHAVRSASFLYPDNASAPGSTAMFVALHGALLVARALALAVWTRSTGGEARLVALLPQREQRTEDGFQMEPPGMNMVYLPFADDIRYPERDPALNGAALVSGRVRLRGAAWHSKGQPRWG